MQCIPYLSQDLKNLGENEYFLLMEEWVSESLKNMGKLTKLGPHQDPTQNLNTRQSHHSVTASTVMARSRIHSPSWNINSSWSKDK